jgi:outer membrane protein OmpA-like peptidoglycan-associated protein
MGMAHSLRIAVSGLALLALAACSDRQIGSELDVAQFGDSTMNNTMIQAGLKDYVMELGGRFSREVPDTVNFAFNSAVLDAGAQDILRRQAHWIRQFPEVRFRVFGHTDLVGSDAYNRSLGLRRAQAVVSFLGTQGISRSRLEAMVSYGKTRPIIQTTNEERQNRRTVTEVSGFVKRHPTVMNGKYAEVVFRDYVKSAEPRHPDNKLIKTQVSETGG